MNAPKSKGQPKRDDSTQRDQLERSQERATEQEPDNFKNESTADKQVEVGPDMTDAPIRGIDPPQQKKSR